MGASVRARLLKLAKERGEDFQLLLSRYANERLLHRLSISAHASQLILKGAVPLAAAAANDGWSADWKPSGTWIARS